MGSAANSFNQIKYFLNLNPVFQIHESEEIYWSPGIVIQSSDHCGVTDMSS